MIKEVFNPAVLEKANMEYMDKHLNLKPLWAYNIPVEANAKQRRKFEKPHAGRD